MAAFAERLYDLGLEALAQQERQVSELRGRGAALVAAGAVVATFLVGLLLRPNDVAESFEERYRLNRKHIERLGGYLAVALGALVTEAAGFAGCTALAS